MVKLVINRQTEDDAESTLAIQCVIQLDIKERTVDVGRRHEQHTATTATHRRTDGQVDRLAWPDVIVRPRREPHGVQVLAKLAHEFGVL